MNKIWNATRFSFQHLEGFEVPAEGRNAVLPKVQFLTTDLWLIQRTKEVVEKVGQCLENYRFSDAANELYHFVWNDFCDWYLEFSKPVLFGDEESQKNSTQLVLAQTLNRIVRLLHPFIPFITEEIFQKLPIRSESCILEAYPTLENDSTWLSLGSEEAAFEIEIVKEVITAIRNIRGENKIKPSEKIEVWLEPKDDFSQKILGNNRDMFVRLASLSSCHMESKENLKKCAVTPIRKGRSEINVVVPLEGLVDIAKELVRLNKSVEKLEKEQSKIFGKLNNKRFVENAPKEVVEADKQALSKIESQIEEMRKAIMRLSE